MVQMMVESFLNSVPLWVWITMVVLAGAVLFYFFSPILVPIWVALPKPVKYALGAIGAVLVAWVGGRHQGRQTEVELRKKKDERAVETRKETHDEVRKLDEPAVDKRLDKWMRD